MLEPPPRTIVRTDEALEKLIVALAGSDAGEIAVAADVTSDGSLRRLTLYAPPVIPTPAIIDVRALSPGAEAHLLKRLSEKVLVVHGAQETLRQLVRWQRNLQPDQLKFWCTWIAAKLVTNGGNFDCALEPLLKRYLHLTIAKNAVEDACDHDSTVEASFAHVADRARHLLTLKHRLAKNMSEENLNDAFLLENRLLPVTHALNENGWQIDLPVLRAERERISASLATGEAVNTGSLHSQLTQVDSWLHNLSGDGRLRCTYDALGAVTGRFSASQPSLQNVPRGRLRRAFCAREGHVLVVGDLNQAELRIAALQAGDMEMLNVFRRGQDLHRQTGAAVLGKSIEEVTSEDRRVGKVANFGLIFGQGVPGFVNYARTQELELTETQAAGIRDRFFETYPDIANWHRKLREAIAPGKLAIGCTTLGRRRYLADDANKWDQFQAFFNYRVQGSAADLFKAALVELHPQLQVCNARLVAVVHDEVIVETPSAATERIIQIIEQTFEETFIRHFDEICESRFQRGLRDLFRDHPACDVQTDVRTNWATKR